MRREERDPVPMTSVLHSLRSLAAKLDFDPIPPTHAAVPYASSDGRRRGATPPLADIYLPEQDGPHPGVLLVHGGGFVIGSRGMKAMLLLAKHVSQAGFAVATVDYRMIGRGGRLAEAIEDVAAAARWWTTVGPAAYASRPGPVSILGLSAGATLSMLAAEEVGADVIGDIVSVFGLYDFEDMKGAMGVGLRRLVVRSAEPEEWAAKSPVHRGPDVPVTLLHGTADQLVPTEQAHRLHAARLAADLPSKLLLYEGARHAFFNFDRIAPSPEAMLDVLHALREAARQR
jgi:acetyl esterase/lipase